MDELSVRGSAEMMEGVCEAFHQNIKELEEANAEKPAVVRSCGELEGTWEEIARAIKSGAEFKSGDYKKGSMVDGQAFTMVVTDVTDEYVRFESRDCVEIGRAHV